MTAICGIGNPGEAYANTRHNVGFIVLDKLAKELGVTWGKKAELKAEIAKDIEYILFKPITYVNLSGKAVVAITNFYKIDPSNLWVVHDDADLPFGKIKVKFGGSDAGHNGINSIDQLLGNNYWRVRIGVGKDRDRNLADHVLAEFTADEQTELNNTIDRAVNLLVQSLKDKQIESQTFNA